MVSVPVKCYAATREDKVSFNEVHQTCGTRTNRPTVCRACDREVTSAELIKGFEHEDKVFTIDDSDFAQIAPESSKTMDVTAFVKREDLDPRFIESQYYALPEPKKGGDRAYALIRAAMAQTGKVAVAKFTRLNRERIVIIAPDPMAPEFLVVSILHWPAELVDLSDYRGMLPKAEFTQPELDVAIQLLEALERPIDVIDSFTDEYRIALEGLRASKIAGKAIEAPQEIPPAKAPLDLVAAMQASLEQAKAKAKAVA